MSIQVGSRVVVDQETDSRGFRRRLVGKVTWRGNAGDLDDLVVVQPVTLFAYHPSAPESGRDLPVGRPEAFSVSEVGEA